MQKLPNRAQKGKKGGGTPKLWLETPKTRFYVKKMACFSGVFSLFRDLEDFNVFIKLVKWLIFSLDLE
jgi:hypothetical protein